MQHRRSDFARQVNERSLGFLGDPERWGSSETIVIPIVNRTEVKQEDAVYTPQLARGQVDSLAAIPWHLFVSCAFLESPRSRVPSGLGLQLAAEITIGVGQTSARFLWDVTANARDATTRGGRDALAPVWQYGPPDSSPGIAGHLQQAIPAAAIAVRAFAYATYDSAEETPAPIPVIITAQICPVAIPGWHL